MKHHFPLYLRVLVGVALGVLLGALLHPQKTSDPAVAGWIKTLGDLGMLPIKALKAIAVPLVFFAILDAFQKTHIPAKRFGKLALICGINVSVAMGIGLFLMNTIQPGTNWRGKVETLVTQTHAKASEAKKSDDPEAPGATLEVVPNLSYYVPTSITRPFVYNNLISVVLLAVLFGAALRKVRTEREEAQGAVQLVDTLYHTLLTVLEWIVLTVPFAVFGLLTKVVGESGFSVFGLLKDFLLVAMLGLLLHCLVYYPLVAWLWGKKHPKVYLGEGKEAIITALSTNSSLATVPITLKCLERMGVSVGSARLAACVGTNLNNDGITLYEAMAALFLTQALGMGLGLGQQLQIVLASIMAGAGVAGVPEAGLVVLPLVLGAAGLPPETIAVALPLLFVADPILARMRSGVNTMSDMVVAILLDSGQPGDCADALTRRWSSGVADD